MPHLILVKPLLYLVALQRKLKMTIAAIYALQQQQKYAGQWVLKGAGSLILEDNLYICTQGNAGMGTGGMGDVLAGMITSLKAQFHQDIALQEIVTLHAQAGDLLAKMVCVACRLLR